LVDHFPQPLASEESTVARPLALVLAVCAALSAALGVAGAAHAADAPTTIAIQGAGLPEITIRQGTDADLFNRLLHQVGWMATQNGSPMKPDASKLGPKYMLTISAGAKPLQRYDLYPQAAGGPKAFRPADQPQGRISDAWFYVSLSVPELLHAAGVPLVGANATDDAGTLVYEDPAGYVPDGVNADRKPLASFTDIMHAQRRTLALWVGTAVLVLLLVIGAARFSRLAYDRR
jgi:hypothetical protein